MRPYDADGGIPTLDMALSDMNTEDLRKLCALTGEKLPARKFDLAQVVIRHLEGERLRTLWQGLDQIDRAAVAEVVHSSSTQFPADRFRAKYGQDPKWGSANEYGCGRNPSVLCFFFYGHRIMPGDLKARLKEFVPPPARPKPQFLERLPTVYERPVECWNEKKKQREHGTEPIPLTVRESERSAQRELLSILRLIEAGKVAVSEKTRRASSASVETITAVLEGGDYYPFVPPQNKWRDENAGSMRAFAWPLLIQAGGLAQPFGSKLQLTKAGRKALVEPAAQTLKILWEKWTDTTLFDELSRIECVKGQTGKGKHGLTAASSRREVISEALVECPVERWISTAEFLRFLRASESEFTVSRNPWSLYICELQYGSLGYSGSEGVLEERYTLCLLFEYAATLGLIDVAFIPPAGARRDYHKLWGTDNLVFFSRYDGLMFFRVTALGAYCLGVTQSYRSAPLQAKQVLRVLPNLEIAAIGAELAPSDRLALDAYAVHISELIWRLEARKLLEAFEAGSSVEEIREFLAARNGAPLPDTVSRLLEDVADRSARVQDCGLARLIECADAALAALIANDTRTRKHCLRAGERHLVVPAGFETAFQRSLRESGYSLLPSERASRIAARRPQRSKPPAP
jgi:Helicase conserved C-terminal domain